MSTTKPILFATDGSPSAAEAQKEAFELAHRLDAPLVVVSVVHAELPAVGYSGYGYSNYYSNYYGQPDEEEAEAEPAEQTVGSGAA